MTKITQIQLIDIATGMILYRGPKENVSIDKHLVYVETDWDGRRVFGVNTVLILFWP